MSASASPLSNVQRHSQLNKASSEAPITGNAKRETEFSRHRQWYGGHQNR